MRKKADIFNLVKGFTLIELLVATTVLILLATVALSVFSRSLRNSAYIEGKQRLDADAKAVVDSLVRFLRPVQVVSLDGQDRSVCLSSGSLTGTVLVVKGLDNGLATIELSGGELASNGAALHPDSLEVESLVVAWDCNYGAPDQLEVTFTAALVNLSTEDVSDIVGPKTFDFKVVSRNISH